MYLFIFEDGEMKVGNTVTDADIKAANNGLVDIVSMKKYSETLRLYNPWDGEWQPIEAL